MNFIKKRNNPNYNFTKTEKKVMRALWLKNAPMSYEEILGACVSNYWPEEYAQAAIDELLRKGVITRLESGRYDYVLEYSSYEKYVRRRKLYLHFYSLPSLRFPPEIDESTGLGPEPESSINDCLKMVDQMLKERKKTYSEST